MKKTIHMVADEVEVGDLVHPPFWTNAPDRVTPVVDLEKNGERVTFSVDGAPDWSLDKESYVKVVQ
jgi:hypothetical protein